MSEEKAEQLINKAVTERQRWLSRGYQNGKFIIGAQTEKVLLASAEYSVNDTIDRDTLLGFDYAVDYQNPYCIHFCPVET